MADGIVQIQPDGGGKKIDTSELLVGANTVERQRMVIADTINSGGLATVQNAVPSATDYGLTVRLAGPLVSGSTQLGGVMFTSGGITPSIKGPGGSAITTDSAMVVMIHPNGTSFAKLVVNTSASVSSHAVVELGVSVGRTQKTITSNSISNDTLNKTIVSYNATAAKSMFVQQITLSAVSTDFQTNAFGTQMPGATYFGTAQIVINGTAINTMPLAGMGYCKPLIFTFPDPIWVAGSTNISLVANPAFTSSVQWYGAIAGFEK